MSHGGSETPFKVGGTVSLFRRPRYESPNIVGGT
jgi:hypothetical protein